MMLHRTLAMRRDGGDHERFRSVIPIRELISIMVMGVQNLPSNSSGMTHFFASVSCPASTCE